MNTSEKAMPYVYMCIHKTTAEFYIGSRTAKTLAEPSHIDFPKYKTSSKKVRPNFDEYDWFILAEFFDGADAYDYEQQRIFEHWGDPLLLNGTCHHNSTPRFSATGKPCSAETRAKLSAANKGKPVSLKSRAKMSAAHKGKTRTEQHKANMSAAHKGKPVSLKSRAKMSASQKGKTLSAETRAKISAAKKGRPVSLETRAKLSAAGKGRIHTPETIAKIIATKKKLKLEYSR